MHEPRIAIIGGGFAGLWAAAAAAAATAAASRASADRPATITLVTPNTSLSVRPRLYEADLEPTVVDLGPIVEPLDIRLHIAAVTRIDVASRTIQADDGATLSFDAAVLAIGSSTPLPPVAGIVEHAHRIDVHHRAAAFRAALITARLRSDAVRVTVVGGGLTGIELAAELASEPDIDVTLIDGGSVGQRFGGAAAALIRTALAELGVKVIDGDRVVATAATAASLLAGGSVDHDLLVWCGGLRANSLTGLDAFDHDDLGRLAVDPQLRLAATAPVWAAGDSARFLVDAEHLAPMSCQFAIPTGRLAGFNAAASVLGLEPIPLVIDRYVTCIDLGRAGALFTREWDQVPALTGAEGKRMKEYINRTAIYPPTDPDALLAAARPDAVAPWT